MTVNTSSKKASHYQVLRETVDVLYDYADTDVRSVHRTLDDANAAAREDLADYAGELDEYEEVLRSDGTVCINTSTGEVDLTVTVHNVLAILPKEEGEEEEEEEERYVYTVTRTDSSSTKHCTNFLGVYRSEDRANRVAERELRCAAGIRNWRDRRRFRGAFREVYGLNGCFEGVITVFKEGDEGRAGREEVVVVVERRALE